MAYRVIKAALVVWLTASIMPPIPASAQSCRQALILGLDVSLSVNLFDFRLQREGLASALTDPQVMDAMVATSGPAVELAVFEWSSQHAQNLLIDWTVIDSRRKLREISAQLRQKPQGMRSGRTALGAAMHYARDMLQSRRHCVNRTLDLSGDGVNNNGVLPIIARPDMAAAGIVVNALVIEPDLPGGNLNQATRLPLSQYFQQQVIVGPASFVETIFGFENYASAIRRKLLRELTPALVRNRPARPGGRGPVSGVQPRSPA